MSYSELLQHPKWQRKRLEILSRDDFRCSKCGDDEKMLHVHHKYYTKGKRPWEYHDDCYLTLCKSCHEQIHYISILNSCGYVKEEILAELIGTDWTETPIKENYFGQSYRVSLWWLELRNKMLKPSWDDIKSFLKKIDNTKLVCAWPDIVTFDFHCYDYPGVIRFHAFDLNKDGKEYAKKEGYQYSIYSQPIPYKK